MPPAGYPGRLVPVLLLAASPAWAGLARAQDTQPPASDTTATQDTVSIPPANASSGSDTPAPSPAPRQSRTYGPWMAEVDGGISDRDGGPNGAFVVGGLTHQLGHIYLRGAFTGYRSTLQRADTALPSTYKIGTLGAGGNFNNWVFDIWGSYGHQQYGDLVLDTGERVRSNLKGSPYWAAGLDFGRILSLGKGWYATPTLAATYTYSRLLRPGGDGFGDFQTSEPAWTGIGTLRIDKSLGHERRSYVGLAASYHLTSNGLSVLAPPDTVPPDSEPPRVIHYSDGWEEAALNSSFHLTRRLWLDASILRSFGVKAGDSTSFSGGLRLNF